MSAPRSRSPHGPTTAPESEANLPSTSEADPASVSESESGPGCNRVELYILIGPAKGNRWQWSFGAHDTVENEWEVHALRQEEQGPCWEYNDFRVNEKKKPAAAGDGSPPLEWVERRQLISTLEKADLPALWPTIYKAKAYVRSQKFNSEQYVGMGVECLRQDNEFPQHEVNSFIRALQRWSGVISKPPNPEDDPDYGIRTPLGY